MKATWGRELKTWKGLLSFLRTAREKDVWSMLEYEVKSKGRESVVRRLYGKASALRKLRELKGISNKLAA